MSGWPDGYDRVVLDRTTSTSLEAARRFPDLAGPTWIFAHEQTEARGRRGRAWAQPKGNFAATLALPNPGPPARSALRSFVSALALFEALSAVDVSGLALKWPNDVLLNGGKLAGILLEGAAGGGLTIGIGVNLADAPLPVQVEKGALPPVSVRGATGIDIAPLDFLTLLATAFAQREAQFSTLGFAPIRTAWLAHAARLGEEIRVRLPREEFRGVFQDIDVDGQLVLSTNQGPRKVAAGDVFF